MSDLSRYFHATLYVFRVPAVTTITARFDETVKHSGARCWWDPVQEIFCLECPRVLGEFCDEALQDIITDYIATELEAADDEEREPNIVRYPQSKFDGLDSVPVEEQPEDDEQNSLQPPPPHVRPVTSHIVVTGEGEGKQIKFFRMHQLPEGFLQRALSPLNARYERLFINGHTCRAVRWDSQNGYVFNGRDGRNAAVPSSDNGELLKAVTFTPLEDTRERSESDEEDGQLLVNQWEHVDGAPRVEDWVRGVGQTRPILSEDEAREDDGNNEQLGSKRPAALIPFNDASSNGSEQTNEDSGHEVEMEQPLAFGDFLKGPTIVDRSDGDASDPEDSALIPRRARDTVPSKPSPEGHGDSLEWSSILRPPPKTEAALRDSTNASSTLTHRPTPSFPEAGPSFPDWGSKYSKVDKVGLLAPAAATAEYELQFHGSRPAAKSKKRSIVARTRDREHGSNTATSEALDNHDEVIDRLGVPSPNFARTMDTMNQKAGKKGKGAKGKKPAFKAQLPLPDPVPAPKPKKVVPDAQVPQKQDKPGKSKAPAAEKQKPGDAFSLLLQDVLEKQLQNNDSESDNDEEFASPQVSMKLTAQVGILLCRSDDKNFGLQKTSPPSQVQGALNSGSSELNAYFLSRITTSDSDAAYLSGMFGRRLAKVETFYEIWIQDVNGWRLKVTVPAADKSKFTIKAHDRETGQACLHYPVRVWDARITLVDPGQVHQTASYAAIADFVSSMHTDGNAPSFRAFVPLARFVIDKVEAPRAFSYQLDDMTYRLIEIQDLEISRHIARRHYNFVAKTAETRDVMAAAHRLWWEVRLETNDLRMVDQLRSRVDEMVNAMDGVGLGNVGPWDIPDEEEEHEEIVMPERVMTGNIEW